MSVAQLIAFAGVMTIVFLNPKVTISAIRRLEVLSHEVQAQTIDPVGEFYSWKLRVRNNADERLSTGPAMLNSARPIVPGLPP